MIYTVTPMNASKLSPLPYVAITTILIGVFLMVLVGWSVVESSTGIWIAAIVMCSVGVISGAVAIMRQPSPQLKILSPTVSRTLSS